LAPADDAAGDFQKGFMNDGEAFEKHAHSPSRISALELAASRHRQSIGPAPPNWHQSPNKISRDMLAESPGA